MDRKKRSKKQHKNSVDIVDIQKIQTSRAGTVTENSIQNKLKTQTAKFLYTIISALLSSIIQMVFTNWKPVTILFVFFISCLFIYLVYGTLKNRLYKISFVLLLMLVFWVISKTVVSVDEKQVEKNNKDLLINPKPSKDTLWIRDTSSKTYVIQKIIKPNNDSIVKILTALQSHFENDKPKNITDYINSTSYSPTSYFRQTSFSIDSFLASGSIKALTNNDVILKPTSNLSSDPFFSNHDKWGLIDKIGYSPARAFTSKFTHTNIESLLTQSGASITPNVASLTFISEAIDSDIEGYPFCLLLSRTQPLSGYFHIYSIIFDERIEHFAYDSSVSIFRIPTITSGKYNYSLTLNQTSLNVNSTNPIKIKAYSYKKATLIKKHIM